MPEGEYVDVPAHRIYVVSAMAAVGAFEWLRSDGDPCRDGDVAYRVVRKRDRKVFRPADYQPTGPAMSGFISLVEA